MNHNLRSRLLSVVSVLALFPAAAWGQSADTTTDTSAGEVHDIVVHDSRDKKDNEEGFVTKSAELGPLGTVSLLDTPYSISVVTSDFIQNYHATSLSDAMKFIPSAQMEARGGMDVGRPQTRGMEGSVVDNNHLDGMNVVSTTAQPMEMLDRVEIISGLTGALYGPASPAGDFNYVLKRPTSDYLNDITAGISKDGAYTVAADIGGTPIKYAGYRINALVEQGDGYVSGSYVDRKLFSGAFDFHITPMTVLEVNASFYRFRKFGYPGSFGYSSSVDLPKAPDATKAGLGQSFAGNRLKTWTESIILKQDLTHGWTLTVGGLNQAAERTMPSITNTLVGDGTFKQTVNASGATPTTFEVLSNKANITGSVNLFDIKNDIVVGTSGYSENMISSSGRSSVSLGTASLSDPVKYSASAVTWQGKLTLSKGSNARVQSAYLGDTLHWNAFSLMMVGSYQHFYNTTYSSGKKASGYGSDGLSSTIALTYKPTTWLMGYISHADTLESGGTASSTTENANEILNPVRSISTELGTKADFGRFNANLALFHITRPMAYTGTDNYYRVQGLQRNNGVEFSVNGNVWRTLRVMAGVTYLNAKMKDAYSESVEGKKVVGVPDYQANILLEYGVPQVKGLFVNTNIHYTDKRPGNSLNSTYADAFTTLDVGLRYELENMDGHTMVFRLNATNILGEKYWASIFPGQIYGSESSSDSAFLGDPAQLHMSVTLKY